MFCQHCGMQNHDNTYRCEDCGALLHLNDPTAGMMFPQNSGLAIASLVCSIVGLVMCPLIGQIVGLVLGYKAKRQIAASGGVLLGEEMASAGIIIGWIGIGLVALQALAALAMFAFSISGIF